MISIFLISWNHKKYIARAIESITLQSFRDFEVIYVDNQSSDGTFETGVELLNKSGLSFKAFKRDQQYNIAANHNFAFTHCSGEYFCPISADDWMHRDNLSDKISAFSASPEIALVYSGGYKYYDDLDIYEPFNVITFPPEMALEELLKRNFISAIGCLIKMKVLEEVGLWNEQYAIEDGDMWVRILTKYQVRGIPKHLFFYRLHSNAFSQDPEKMYKAKMEWFQAHKHLNKYPEHTIRNNVDSYLAARVRQETSLALFIKVLKHFRLNKLYPRLLIKSLLPVRWKKQWHKRSLIKKFNNIRPYS